MQLLNIIKAQNFAIQVVRNLSKFLEVEEVALSPTLE